ncbi:[protein-PII] uridylyltransferase [Xanthomonadaceae bacterium XH05]|nr:[protein-PII] uridylyltransferase [Xanthomonadaceae bacterium XH05]
MSEQPSAPLERTDDAWKRATRMALEETDRLLAEAFDRDEDIDRLLARRAQAVDRAVIGAWTAIFEGAPGLALVATGGYGRGELFPYSDVDLLVLAEDDVQERCRAGIERWFALLWDIGLTPGHAVRSVTQCVEAAREDVTVATAILEARPLVGDNAALSRLLVAMRGPDLWPPAEFLAAKRAEWRARHARYNDTAYNLEPNLKDGPGGLRDIHTLGWLARRIFGVQGLGDLVALGALGTDEFDAIDTRRRALSRLRFGLHLVAGRREERLLFDYQKALAERLKLHDEHRDNLAVEQLMQGFFRSAALVQRLGDRLLQRFDESLQSAPDIVPLEGDFVRIGDSLALRDVGLMYRRPTTILHLFRTWQKHPEIASLHSATARALGEALSQMDDRFRSDEGVRALFMQLVRDPHAVPTLERMARLGVLGRYLPAFGRVAGRMQYDLFHVYTVDEHTLAVLRNIASFSRPESIERFALGHELWSQLRKPELLLLAGLFHDIAKGRGGDHSVLGALDAREFCETHGLSAADTDLVVWLVRQHLVMSITAQRKDISDPDVVSWFAYQVAERERLDYLYLLTVADIAGTSPKLWNAWKDRLMADLHGATRFALRRGLAQRLHVDERIAETREAARQRLTGDGLDDATIERIWSEFPGDSFLRYRAEQLAWQTRGIADAEANGLPVVLVRPHARPGALEVFVYSHDRDGLFASAAATLDRLGLSIVDARILTSRGGMTLDTFQLLDNGMESVAPERRASVVAQCLRDSLRDPGACKPPARRAMPRHLRHFRVPVQIEFSEQGAGTLLTLVCSDRPGLLAQVAAVLREHRVRVHDARIATFGERAEDFFLVTGEDDQPLSPEGCERLREAILECVGSG